MIIKYPNFGDILNKQLSIKFRPDVTILITVRTK